ncbi:MAG: GNAT family N-acetyltransferase [Campylobacterota bacterium]|nr:GNAT family N-acetyltransferase [Campylobacterota bacterium]
MNTVITRVNYLDPKHANDLCLLMNTYAKDPMGGAEELNEETLKKLPLELSKLPHAFSVLCYVDDTPAGLINCFTQFSTFSCQPLVNIHDIVVVQQHRGKGLNQIMLNEVEKIAKEKGCCKLTLEVLEGNDVAKSSYTKFGFSAYELDPKMGVALFWQKNIN